MRKKVDEASRKLARSEFFGKAEETQKESMATKKEILFPSNVWQGRDEPVPCLVETP